MESYETILTRMEDKYYELTGLEPERAGDTEIKLRLLAGEIYALGAQTDWLRRQLLPDTATGIQLDKHAAICGLSRIKGRKAQGDIAFSVDMPLEFDVEIPAGTICTTADGTLNYVTVSDGVIYRGDSFALIPAEAENSGSVYNAVPGTITTIVTYFSVGLSVENSSAFSGGTDDESDESLRKRIEKSYGNISNGVNPAYYIKLAKSVPEVNDAAVIPTSPGFDLHISGRGYNVAQEVMQQVQELVDENICAGVTATVKACTIISSTIAVALKVKSGYEALTVIQDTEAVIREHYSSMGIGEEFTLAALGAKIIAVPGVENYVFTAGQDITPGRDEFVAIGSITISEMR